MRDLTVVYYTSNREKPEFESKIRNRLWRTIKPLRLPLISVSQKPISFGHNICVGEHEACSHNAWRQLQIGAQAANTKYICTAESDFLYPREYFHVKPASECEFVRAMPVYMLVVGGGRRTRAFYRKPTGSEAAIVVGRDYLIARIQEMLHGHDTWGSNGPAIFLYEHRQVRMVNLSQPIVTFKTARNMHVGAPVLKSTWCQEIPHWGHVDELVRFYTP